MPPRQPYKVQGTGHTPTVAIRSPGGRSHPIATIQGPGVGHASTTTIHGPKGQPHPPAAIRGPGNRPRLDNGHMGARGAATIPRQPYACQGTVHALKAAIRRPGDRPRPHGGHTEPSGPATLQRQQYEAQGTGHAPTASVWGPGVWPRFHGTYMVRRRFARPQGGHTGPADRLRLHGFLTEPGDRP